jgi:hypothetical protein
MLSASSARSGGACLDHVVVFGEAHLRRTLAAFWRSRDGVARIQHSLRGDAIATGKW